LVGDKDREAVAVVVAEAQLGTGMGVLSSADRPGARWPGVQVDPGGQLHHHLGGGQGAVGVAAADLEADGHVVVPAVVDQGASGARAASGSVTAGSGS
jgi:hypothetical protein